MDGSIEKIKSIPQKKLLFLLVLGPMALILSLAVCFFKPVSYPFYLTVTVCGFFLSYQWGMKGFLVSVVALAAFSFKDHPDRLWQVLFSCSLLLGFFITALATQEVRREVNLLQTEFAHSQEKLENLQQDAIKKERTYRNEIIDLEDQLKDARTSMHTYEALVEVTKNQLQHLEAENQKLFQEVVKRYDHIPEIVSAEDKDVRDQYKQLRRQFEEKSEVLSDTRRQLFLVENELLATEKKDLERQEHEFEEFIQWQKLFLDLQKQQEYLRSQIADMEQVISALMKHS